MEGRVASIALGSLIKASRVSSVHGGEDHFPPWTGQKHLVRYPIDKPYFQNWQRVLFRYGESAKSCRSIAEEPNDRLWT
jgi:hypothetical protein